MANLGSVSRRLWGRVQSGGSELPFDPGCEDLIKQLINDAANRIEIEGFSTDTRKLKKADEAIDKLISEMISLARQRGYSQLHEDTFYDALKSLCPIWPIC